jgi:hypothetical protein
MDVNLKPSGRIVARLVDVRTGEVLAVRRLKNLQLYEGSDILGRLLAGYSEYAPNTLYLEYQNGGIPPSVTPTRGEGRSYYAALEGSADQDYLRVPIVFKPALSATDANFVSNVVTFTVMSVDQPGAGGKGFSNLDNSQVYGLALVTALDLNDRTQDLVFARGYFDPITKGDTTQVSVTWSYEFP